MATLASVAIVGASLSGHAFARALRGQGYDGRLTVVGAESHRPYDRPPLSKEYLLGTAASADLGLEAEDENLSVDWVLGDQAVGLELSANTVTLASGGKVTADAVVIATGSRARTLPVSVARPGLRSLHTLRTIEDADALRADLTPGARLVVIGAGFIGAEVASTAQRLGLEVTVLEAIPTPLSRQLGGEMGAVVADLHRANGVALVCGVAVQAVLGDTRVTGVQASDGRVFPADVVLAGVGSAPAVDWLRGSGLDLAEDGGVLADESGRTAAERVLAVGDCASWFDPAHGAARRVEHWTDSRERPARAVTALLTGEAATVPLKAPYFWSDQYGVRIQFAGHRLDSDVLTIEDGSADRADLLAVWRRDGLPVAVLGMNQPRAFTKIRKGLALQPLSVGS